MNLKINKEIRQNLSSLDSIPQELLTREKQLDQIKAAIQPALKGISYRHLWLHGGPGTGKTETATFILDQLRDESGVEGFYINCWEKNTLYSIISKILEAMGNKGLGIRRTNERSTSEKLDDFRRYLENLRLCIIILDEIDFLPPKERNKILHRLSSIPKVGLICTGQDKLFSLRLDERVRSRFSPKTVKFPPYSIRELITILKGELAELSVSLDEKLIKKVAEFSEGDARRAVRNLQVVCHEAETGEHITQEQLQELFNFSPDKVRRRLQTLDPQKQLILEVVKEAEEIISGDFWNRYLVRCEEKGVKPVEKRTFNKYLKELYNRNFITKERARKRGNFYIYSLSPGVSNAL